MRKISPKKVARISMVVGGSLLLLNRSGAAGESVAFAWSPNSEPEVAGYKIYYGVASRTYTQVFDAGNGTTATISNLVPGTTYYFALTAYNTLGLESDFTGELVYSVPMRLAPLQIRIAPPRQTVLTVTGTVGHTYDIEASADLMSWTTIGAVTIGPTGSSVFTENNPVSRSKRFYRARAFQP
jgi:fibronectin type III domain protein